MYVDVCRLKEKTIEHGFTVEQLANALKINPSTYYRKIGSGGGAFTLMQAIQMSEVLSLTREECASIFFADKLA